MKQLLFFIGLLASVGSIQAQAPTWQWARRGGGYGSPGGQGGENDAVVGIVTDKNGNTYSLLTMDGGGARVLATSNNIPADDSDIAIIGGASRGADICLVSYSSCGKLRWYKVIGTKTGDYGRGIGIDSLGNIYATFISYLDNIKIGNDTTLPNSTNKSIGIAKFDSSGHYKWVKQPNPDTTSYIKNLGEYEVLSSVTTPSGDTYMLCGLGTGLISGSTNLVVTTSGWYVLQYNSVGVPKSLVKMDVQPGNMSLSLGNIRFYRSKTGKFFLSLLGLDYNSYGTPSYFGNQKVNTPMVIGCFTPNGQFLWKITNSDSAKLANGASIHWDEDRKLLYFGGFIRIGDTILGQVGANRFGDNGQTFSMVGCVDTLGNKIWLRQAYQKTRWSGFSGGGNITSNNLFVGGGSASGELDWGSGYVCDKFKQGYIASFDATTGNFINIDSVYDDGGDSFISVNAADNNNNIYTSIDYTNHLYVGNQDFYVFGGTRDFAITKWGFNNCSTVPLKFINFTVSSPLLGGVRGGLVKNLWTTANEINVSRFNIQRSTNGKDWETVGVVMAKNTASNDYTFVDELTTKDQYPKTLYYRIESIDYDGQVQYSEVRAWSVNNAALTINVYPNPAKDYINIEGKNIKQLDIIDYLGKVIFTKANGISNLTNINIQHLPQGFYVLKIIDESKQILTKKIIKE